MRSDLAKVLLDNPRTGRGNKTKKNKGPKGTKKKLHKELESGECRKQETMAAGPRFGYDSKDSDIKYSLLKKMVRSQIGRKWDKVYSEFCHLLNRNNDNLRRGL